MRPEFLDSMSWAMAEVYGAVTDRILVNLARHFKYVKNAPQGGAFAYQARKLAELGQVTRETEFIILDSLKNADEALQGCLEAAIRDALKTVDPQLRKAAEKGLLLGGGFLPPEVAPKQTQAFKLYYAQSADKLNLVNTTMLQSTQAAYTATVADIAASAQTTQSIMNVAAGEVVTGVSTWNTAMRDAVKKMVDNGLTGFVDRAGRQWSPEAYAAMDIRTTVFNTARQSVFERNAEYGNDLYQVSTHAGARPLCYPWQGKVISSIDASRDVEDLDGNVIHVYAQSETSYGEPAGLFGINCGHYPMVFIPGVSTIRGEPQSPEENAKTYAESQKQRQLERDLRYEKRDLAVMQAQGADTEMIAAQKARVREASAKLDSFTVETGRARQRSREWIGSAETALQTATNGGTMAAGWDGAGFLDSKAQDRHTRHLLEYGTSDVNEYLKGARELLNTAASNEVYGFENDQGGVYRYNPQTNDFAIGAKIDGRSYVITRFRPKDGMEYWERVKKSEHINP